MAYFYPEPPPRIPSPEPPERQFNVPSSPDRLLLGEGLRTGQSLWSPNRKAELAFQPDGNFVLYMNKEVRWVYQTWRSSDNAHTIMMQPDGNLVGETYKRHAVWATGTSGQATAILKDEGYFVVEVNGSVQWDSRDKKCKFDMYLIVYCPC